ncbi:MAG TPA: hypothetical protein VF572_05195 [Candidatus Saccharimonadales bacterium]|jgi:hypothetical protein
MKEQFAPETELTRPRPHFHQAVEAPFQGELLIDHGPTSVVAAIEASTSQYVRAELAALRTQILDLTLSRSDTPDIAGYRNRSAQLAAKLNG